LAGERRTETTAVREKSALLSVYGVVDRIKGALEWTVLWQNHQYCRLLFIIDAASSKPEPSQLTKSSLIEISPKMSMSIEDAMVPREPKPFPNTPENVLEQFSMKGKVVAITGASDGIGWAVAEAIAEAGGDVALWYNTNDAAISKGQKLAEKHSIRAKAYQVEVSDHTKVERAIAQVVSDFGKLDVFVANAGMAISKPITEQTIEEYKKQYAVNGMCITTSPLADCRGRILLPCIYICMMGCIILTNEQSTASSIAPSMQVTSSSSRASAT
jgi:hypothetical protein